VPVRGRGYDECVEECAGILGDREWCEAICILAERGEEDENLF